MADPLRGAWLRRHLHPVRVLVYARLGSTQRTALTGLEAGRLAPPALVAASRQTAGRGQRNNRWWSDGGTLCASLVLPVVPGLPVGQVPLRAGLAVARVLERHLPGARVQLKWPNDVLVEGRKIAGLLCHRARGADVIGLGLNVATDLRRSPDEVRRRATSLRTARSRPPRRDTLLIELWEALQIARHDDGWQDAYHRLHALQEARVRVEDEGGPCEGYCRGVDEEGRLVVDTPTGLLALDNGTVRPLPPAR